MSKTPLDEIDRTILYHLQEDGRRAVTEIADAVGLSDNAVRNRLQAMEEAGIITGYGVDVDYDRAGIPHHYVFVCTARPSERERLAADTQSLPSVVDVTTLMTGTNNVLLVAVRETKDEITDLAYAIDDLGLRIDHEHLIRDQTSKPYSGFHPSESRS